MPTEVSHSPMWLHTCDYSVDVRVDEALLDMLMEEPSEATKAAGTSFERWVHGHVLYATGYQNQ